MNIPPIKEVHGLFLTKLLTAQLSLRYLRFSRELVADRMESAGHTLGTACLDELIRLYKGYVIPEIWSIERGSGATF